MVLPMADPLRVIVADDEPEMREWFADTLEALGHQMLAACADGRELVAAATSQEPDLIITDIKMPGIDGLEAARQISRTTPVPIILVSAHHEPDLLDRACDDSVLAYLVKPIKQADLETAIALARRRFREFRALHQQCDDLRQALEDRKVVERAKGILMKRAGLEEPEAFRRLQKLASEKNKKMIEIARAIVTADEAMN